jgi:hypothetical protein
MAGRIILKLILSKWMPESWNRIYQVQDTDQYRAVVNTATNCMVA